MTFQGYRRQNGGAGTRNHVLVIPSVGCSQGVAQAIARGRKGVVCLANILGCGQVGPDRALVKKTLAGFGVHPNVYAVLIVGNGCEHLTAEELAQAIVPSGKRVEALVVQTAGGSKKTALLGRKIVREMVEAASRVSREPLPVAELILGTECGGSDYSSGLASNPALGHASDLLVREGGTIILSETPELIGAEHLVEARARTPDIGRKVLDTVAWWEKKAMESGQDVREANPSPGNIAGGITTLEEKSLGCIYKAGTAPLEEVISYASSPSRRGLVYMDTPAHDIAPVIKITANRETYLAMRDDMDLDVSGILRGAETAASAGNRIFSEIVSVASGKLTKAERNGQADFCMFKVHINI